MEMRKSLRKRSGDLMYLRWESSEKIPEGLGEITRIIISDAVGYFRYIPCAVLQ